MRVSFRERRTQVVAGVVAVVLVVAVAGLAMASGHKKASAPTTSAAARTTTSTTKPKPKPTGVIAPLTGVRDSTGAAAHRPALTVKVENTNLADPQIGLGQADVVYEEVVEGSITRLLAIFQSHVPPVVGPIRSVRRTDQSVVTPVGGLFVYSGGAAYAIQSIESAPVTRVDETRAGSAMFRDPSRSKPHNLFGRGPDLFAIGGTPVPPPRLFTYRAAGQPVAGSPVVQFDVHLGGGFASTYRWDAAHARWTRTADDSSHQASGIETPRNVVVMFVNYQGGVGVIGSEAQLAGSGTAIVFSGGHRIDGRWVRPDRAKPARFVDAAGATIPLTPGQTWVDLAPIGTAVS